MVKEMRKVFLLGLFLVSACTSNHIAIVQPELLINSSAEKVSFPITTHKSVYSVADWIKAGDAPSSAEIFCKEKSRLCGKVRAILKSNKVPFEETTIVASNEGESISLIYDRLTASSCFINQLGCATSLNAVRMVANREQFIKPYLSDLQDAETAVRALDTVR